MKRFLIVLGCCASLNSWGQQSSSTDEDPNPRPVYRCLILIDTSSAMSRQKDVTTDTVSKLVLGSFGGRIRTGDAWTIWVFDDRLRTNGLPPQTWDPRQRQDIATRAYRFLNEQRFNRKKAALDKAMDALNDEAELSGDLTVFLFTDGSKPVKGTPFDEPINEIFTKHSSGMRKAKKPFVAVLVAQGGKFSAHAVSPGGDQIYIPRLAKVSSPTLSNSTPKREATATNTAQPSPARKTMTVEEIAAALRQSQKVQTNTVATAPPPLIVLATNSSQGPTNEADKPVTVAAPPGSNAVPGDTNAATAQGAFAAATNVPLPVGPAASVRPESGAPTNKAISAPDESAVPGTARTNEIAVATAQKSPDSVEEHPGSLAASPQSAVLVQPGPAPGRASNAWKYLVAAAALLLAALTLAWLYIRSIRYVPRPSLISRSMEKDTTKSK
jgi:hypothetical protein